MEGEDEPILYCSPHVRSRDHSNGAVAIFRFGEIAWPDRPPECTRPFPIGAFLNRVFQMRITIITIMTIQGLKQALVSKKLQLRCVGAFVDLCANFQRRLQKRIDVIGGHVPNEVKNLICMLNIWHSLLGCVKNSYFHFPCFRVLYSVCLFELFHMTLRHPVQHVLLANTNKC